MSIALVTGQTAVNQSTSLASPFKLTATLPAGATAGSLLVLWVTYFQSSPAATPVTDDKGNTWVQAGVWKSTTGGGFDAIFYAKNVIAATSVLTWTHTASAHVTLALAEFSGADTSTPLDTTVGNTATSGTSMAPGSITPAGAGELFIFSGTTDSGASTTTPTGYTNVSRQTGATFQPLEADYFINTGTTASAPTSTIGGSTKWAANLAAFKASTGGSALSFSGSGAAAASGTAGITKSLHKAGAGAAAASGTAGAAKALHVAASGGAAASGVASAAKALHRATVGGAAASGTAGFAKALRVAGLGAAAASGTAAKNVALHVATAGGSTAVTAAGIAKSLHVVGTGTALAGSSAVASRALRLAGIGGAAASGTAAKNIALHIAGSGGAIAGGSATFGNGTNFSFAGSGHATASGTAGIAKSLHVAASGGATAGGAAAASRLLRVAASGTVTAGGVAIARIAMRWIGAGGAAASGTATVTRNGGAAAGALQIGALTIHPALQFASLSCAAALQASVGVEPAITFESLAVEL